MKIIIDTDDKFTETEITIKCRHIGDDIEKLLASIRMLDMKLTGQKDGRQYFIEVAEIMYIESIDKRTFIYTIIDIYESPFKLYELEAKLADKDFLRASKNCLFNISHVQSIEPDLDRRLIITMRKDLKIMVSRQYSATVKQKLEAYNV